MWKLQIKLALSVYSFLGMQMDLRPIHDVTLQDGLLHMARNDGYADGNFLYRTYNTFYSQFLQI